MSRKITENYWVVQLSGDKFLSRVNLNNHLGFDFKATNSPVNAIHFHSKDATALKAAKLLDSSAHFVEVGVTYKVG